MLTVTASTASKTEEYEAFSKAVRKVSQNIFNYTYNEPVNNFVANFHDSVSIFSIKTMLFGNKFGCSLPFMKCLLIPATMNEIVRLGWMWLG